MHKEFKLALIDLIRNPMNKQVLKDFYNARFFGPDCKQLANKFRMQYLEVLDEIRQIGTPEITVVICMQRLDEVSFEVDIAIQDQQNEGLIPFIKQQDRNYEYADIRS